MSTDPTRPVLRYHGGKWKLAPWIIGHFPEHRVYVEPYGGAASVLLRKVRTPLEVWNDLDHELVNLFAVLRDPALAAELVRLVELTPFARAEFELSYELTDDLVERARRMLLRSAAGYGSKACVSANRNGFRSKRAAWDSPAQDWRRYPPALAAVIRRLQGVTLENLPALDVIQRYDEEAALFYVDPPYLHGVRNLEQGVYRHELSDEDHEALARTLHGVRGGGDRLGLPERDVRRALRRVDQGQHQGPCGQGLAQDRVPVDQPQGRREAFRPPGRVRGAAMTLVKRCQCGRVNRATDKLCRRCESPNMKIERGAGQAPKPRPRPYQGVQAAGGC